MGQPSAMRWSVSASQACGSAPPKGAHTGGRQLTCLQHPGLFLIRPRPVATPRTARQPNRARRENFEAFAIRHRFVHRSLLGQITRRFSALQTIRATWGVLRAYCRHGSSGADGGAATHVRRTGGGVRLKCGTATTGRNGPWAAVPGLLHRQVQAAPASAAMVL